MRKVFILLLISLSAIFGLLSFKHFLSPRRACASDPEIGCQIKGNLDRWDHRWYHLSSFRHYDQVVMNLENGDRWFCTEEQVQAAGFTRARE